VHLALHLIECSGGLLYQLSGFRFFHPWRRHNGQAFFNRGTTCKIARSPEDPAWLLPCYATPGLRHTPNVAQGTCGGDVVLLDQIP
jgi:hypothetical protein